MYTADEANQNYRNILFSTSWNTHSIKNFHIKLHVLMKSIYIIPRTKFCIISQLGDNWQLYNYQLESILHSYWTSVHDLGRLHSIYTTQNQIYQTTSCAFCHKLYFTKISGVVGWEKIPQYNSFHSVRWNNAKMQTAYFNNQANCPNTFVLRTLFNITVHVRGKNSGFGFSVI
jgi:hypothetical protein